MSKRSNKPIVKGSQPTLKATFLDQDGSVVDLTGSTVQVVHRVDNGEKTTSTATVTAPATNGIATYQLSTADTNEAPGYLRWEWKITDATGDIFYNDEAFERYVRDNV